MNDAPRRFLRALFDAAVTAADPARCLAAHLPSPPEGRTVVIGAGKAAAAMAAAVEAAWPHPVEGLVVTPYGHGVRTRGIEVIEAAHPVPDLKGCDAAARILSRVEGLGAGDLVLCLLSGGGSALLALPAPGVTLEDKQAVTRDLLKAGSTIGEINTVRKHLSAIKGGRLARAAFPAPIVTLAISDVAGDDPATIASGPTVADPTTRAEAQAILGRYGVRVPNRVAAHLARSEAETPKPGDPAFRASSYHLIVRPRDGLAAAVRYARAAGGAAEILGVAIEGEARDVAAGHAALVETRRRSLGPGESLVLLSGGELTVSHSGQARGGPNQEYVLALALALGERGVFALACDTDGIDGSSDAAGAIVTPDMLARGQARGLDAHAHLARHATHDYFAALGDHVTTGPTRTNINDFRAILIART